MSGTTLPRTGIGAATITIGSAAYGVPVPVLIAVAGAALVLAGAVILRLTWRRNRAVNG